MKLKDDYTIANCCQPTQEDEIIGYYSHNNIIKVHKLGCPNLTKAEQGRLVALEWAEIVVGMEFHPDDDYSRLDSVDFSVLDHHLKYGFDYSLKMASLLHLDKKTMFDKHSKLREMKLLERVEPKMIQYRKNIVKGKWIKHRNHTYYDLTEKGRLYLDHYLHRKGRG